MGVVATLRGRSVLFEISSSSVARNMVSDPPEQGAAAGEADGCRDLLCFTSQGHRIPPAVPSAHGPGRNKTPRCTSSRFSLGSNFNGVQSIRNDNTGATLFSCEHYGVAPSCPV
ncbi:hypothetical protein NHX12_031389 [Muraenolepis orangiensis]|uniref:Uncharacterized protein n=1 Tax=Muraenolepis orangiensis TaxID=630683 RepID=A0A9Q0E4E4_9TELE|nr:hypothetical protein NHX12_031389 [Muraenolepis orangiensis]